MRFWKLYRNQKEMDNNSSNNIDNELDQEEQMYDEPSLNDSDNDQANEEQSEDDNSDKNNAQEEDKTEGDEEDSGPDKDNQTQSDSDEMPSGNQDNAEDGSNESDNLAQEDSAQENQDDNSQKSKDKEPSNGDDSNDAEDNVLPEDIKGEDQTENQPTNSEVSNESSMGESLDGNGTDQNKPEPQNINQNNSLTDNTKEDSINSQSKNNSGEPNQEGFSSLDNDISSELEINNDQKECGNDILNEHNTMSPSDLKELDGELKDAQEESDSQKQDSKSEESSCENNLNESIDDNTSTIDEDSTPIDEKDTEEISNDDDQVTQSDDLSPVDDEPKEEPSNDTDQPLPRLDEPVDSDDYDEQLYEKEAPNDNGEEQDSQDEQEVQEEQDEIDLSNANQELMDKLKELPPFQERYRSPGYAIDTNGYTDVPDSVIRTLINKFLNQRFNRNETDLNIRSNSLEETRGFYKWDVKSAIIHLETDQITKVLNDKYGYKYADGKNENVPLSFYFDLSGSMAEYTNLLATIAIELLKKDVKVLVGYNEKINYQIDSIKKVISVADLASLLTSAGAYNASGVKSNEAVMKRINQNIDTYLIKSKAEKCVVFTDFDPLGEVINLSKHCNFYWFCFKQDIDRNDLSNYRGFLYTVQNIKDIANALLKVSEYQFQTLCHIEKQKVKTKHR